MYFTLLLFSTLFIFILNLWHIQLKKINDRIFISIWREFFSFWWDFFSFQCDRNFFPIFLIWWAVPNDSAPIVSAGEHVSAMKITNKIYFHCTVIITTSINFVQLPRRRSRFWLQLKCDQILAPTTGHYADQSDWDFYDWFVKQISVILLCLVIPNFPLPCFLSLNS